MFAIKALFILFRQILVKTNDLNTVFFKKAKIKCFECIKVHSSMIMETLAK